MKKPNLKKVWKIYHSIIREDLLDDRREYDIEDLQSTYSITETEAKFLANAIKKAAEK